MLACTHFALQVNVTSLHFKFNIKLRKAAFNSKLQSDQDEEIRIANELLLIQTKWEKVERTESGRQSR